MNVIFKFLCLRRGKVQPERQGEPDVDNLVSVVNVRMKDYIRGLTLGLYSHGSSLVALGKPIRT